MRKMFLMVLCAAFLGAGCDSTPSDTVDTAVDNSVNFCNYHTFSFYKIEEAEGSEPPTDVPASVTMAEPLFKNAVRSELAAASVTESETSPDLRVNFLWAINESTQIMTDCGSYWYGGYFGYTCIDYVEEVPIGTVIIDLVDRLQDKVVFRGIIQGILDGEDTEDRINDAVAKMFEAYPPNITPCL